jgi:hypothetical protein
MVAPSDLLTQLGAAIHEERASRKAAQEASSRQDQLLQQLRAERVPYTAIAHHIAKAEGLTPSVQERKRIAQKLRQRVTRRHSSLGATGSHETAAPLSLAHHTKEQIAMPKLIKRVTTEEFIADEDETLDGLDETGDDEQDEGGEDEEEEEERPRRRK